MLPAVTSSRRLATCCYESLGRLPVASTSLLVAATSSSSVRRHHRTLHTSTTRRREEATPVTKVDSSSLDKNQKKKKKERRLEDVLQTVPFAIGPDAAIQSLSLAAHSMLGIKHVAMHLLSRFLKTFLGYDFATEVKMLAFKPVLLPSWRCDVRLKGRAVLDNIAFNWRISAPNAITPALNLVPLMNLSLSAPFDVPPEPFVPSKHKHQHGVDIDALPFTRSPVDLVKQLVKMPRTSAVSAGIDIDPKQIEPVLFAAYPLYLPVYLGEFVETTGDERRITCVVHASTAGISWSAFLPFKDPPTWMPPSTSLELLISGGPQDPTEARARDAVAKFRPMLSEFANVGTTAHLALATPLPKGGLEGVLDNPAVMPYEPNAALNKAYMEAEEELADAKSKLQHLTASASESAKMVALSFKGVKIAPVRELQDILQAQVDEKQKKVDEMRPAWLEPNH